MTQERDGDGRLVYSDRSNCGAELDTLIGGRRGARSGAHSTGRTPAWATNTESFQHRLYENSSTPIGRVRR